MAEKRIILNVAGVCAVLFLAGCSILQPGPASVTPEPPAEGQDLTEEPGEDPVQPTEDTLTGRAFPGDVIFVRDAQLLAISIETREEHVVAEFEGDVALRELSLSPDGSHLVFIAESAAVVISDLSTGTTDIRALVSSAIVSSPAWSFDGSAVYYQKVPLDPLTFAPQPAELWRVSVDAGAQPELIASAADAGLSELLPRYELPDGSLVVTGVAPDGETVSHFVLAGGEFLPYTVAGFDTISLLDVSIQQFKVLLSDPAGSAIYIASLDPLVDGEQTAAVSSQEGAVYHDVRFLPGGDMILALRASGQGQPFEAVLFRPGEDGIYTETVLSPDPAYTTLSARWDGDARFIVQRLPVNGGDSEIWILPTDGSTGALLTGGEAPIPVPVE